MATGRVMITGMQLVAVPIVAAVGTASRLEVSQWRMT